jgi:hypothetical protein
MFWEGCGPGKGGLRLRGGMLGGDSADVTVGGGVGLVLVLEVSVELNGRFGFEVDVGVVEDGFVGRRPGTDTDTGTVEELVETCVFVEVCEIVRLSCREMNGCEME